VLPEPQEGSVKPKYFFRGGSWYNSGAPDMRPTVREGGTHTMGAIDIGFRCSLNLKRIL
jgi:formylglycine-generating enzyme required for sulfatase activity